MDSLVKEMTNLKKKSRKNSPGNLRHHEKTKSMNNGTRVRRRNPGKRCGKYFQQNHRIFPYPKEGIASQHKRSI